MLRPAARLLALGVVVVTTLAVAIPSFTLAALDTPQILSYQGRLTDAQKVTVPDGARNMKFAIYDASVAGTCVWSAGDDAGDGVDTVFSAGVDCPANVPSTTIPVTVTDGLFTVMLGDTTTAQNAFPDALFNTTSPRYLEITIDGETLTPRRRIVSSATALQAGNASLLDNFNTSQTGGLSAYVPVTENDGDLVLSANFTVDTNTLFVDAGNNRVGIGTNAPNRQLDIVGLVNGDVGASIRNTSAGDVAQAFLELQNDTGVGYVIQGSAGITSSSFDGYDNRMALYSYSTDGVSLIARDTGSNSADIRFYTGSSDISNRRMTITSTGNIGINDTSPAALLTVGASDAFQVNTSGRVLANIGASGAGNLAYSFVGDTDTGLYRSATNEMRLQTAGSDRVTVDASGNVGVGTTTPLARMVINGTGVSNEGLLGLEGTSSHVAFSTSAGTYKGFVGYFDSVGHGNDADLNLKTGYNGSSKIRLSVAGDTETMVLEPVSGSNYLLRPSTTGSLVVSATYTALYGGVGAGSENTTVARMVDLDKPTLFRKVASTGGNLNVSQCNGGGSSDQCTSVSATITAVTGVSDFEVIERNDLAWFVYTTGGTDVILIQCTNGTCSTMGTPIVIDSSANAKHSVGLALAANNDHIGIAWAENTGGSNYDVKFRRCNDPSTGCTSLTAVQTLASFTNANSWAGLSLVIQDNAGADYPLVIYHDLVGNDDHLTALACSGGSDCSGGVTSTALNIASGDGGSSDAFYAVRDFDGLTAFMSAHSTGSPAPSYRAWFIKCVTLTCSGFSQSALSNNYAFTGSQVDVGIHRRSDGYLDLFWNSSEQNIAYFRRCTSTGCAAFTDYDVYNASFEAGNRGEGSRVAAIAERPSGDIRIFGHFPPDTLGAIDLGINSPSTTGLSLGSASYKFGDLYLVGDATLRNILASGIVRGIGGVTAGTSNSMNALDVGSEGVAIGTTYAGTIAAPTNGMIVQGNVGIGDSSPLALLTVGSGDLFQVNASGNLTSPNDVTWSLGGGVNGLNFDSNTLSIDAANNRIGIGTAAPTSDLHVVSSAVSGVTINAESTVATGAASLLTTNSNNSAYGQLTAYGSSYVGTEFGQTLAGSAFLYLRPSVAAGNAVIANIVDAKDIIFGTTSGVSQLERMRITSSGNIGIGADTTPDALFSVGSTSQFRVNASGRVQADVGASGSGNLAYSFVGDDDTGFYRSGSGAVAFAFDGSNSVGMSTSRIDVGPDANAGGSDYSTWQYSGTGTTSSVSFGVSNNVVGERSLNLVLNNTTVGAAGPHFRVRLNPSNTLTTMFDIASDLIQLVPNGGNVAIGTTASTARLTVGASTSATEERLIIQSQVDAVLELSADTDDAGGENDNPYILLKQDTGGNNTHALIGLQGDLADTAPNGESFLGAGKNNGLLLGNFGQDPIQMGVDGRVLFHMDGMSDALGLYTIAPSNPFQVSPIQYETGTASQTGTTITGVGTTFTDAMVGSLFTFNDGTVRTITAFTDATTLTVAETGAVASQNYRINYKGLNVTSSGDVVVGGLTTTHDFEVVDNYEGTVSLLVRSADTDGAGASAQIIVDGGISGGGDAGFYIRGNGTTLGSMGSAGANIGFQNSTGGGYSFQTSGSLDVLWLDDGGNIGLGDITPTEAKLVVGSAGAGDIYATFAASANTERLCWDGAGASLITDCSGSPGDYAEMFGTSDASVSAADIVMLDESRDAVEVIDDGIQTSKAYVLKATKEKAHVLFGVVATAPNETIGQAIKAEENPRPIALSGRVPVKVSTENGPIRVGDPITISSIPGVGAKATTNGMIVGFALSSFSGSGTGRIVVSVHTGWWNGVQMANTASQITPAQMVAFDIYQDVDFAGYAIHNVKALSSQNWSITDTGHVIAKKILADEFAVRITNEKATIGQAQITTGQQNVLVSNTSVTPTSKIFLTWRGSPGSFAVVSQVNAGSFAIDLDAPALRDATFDYWVVQVEDARVTEPESVQIPSQPITTNPPLPPAESTQLTEPATSTQPTEPAESTTPTEPAEIIVQEPVPAAPTAPVLEPVAEPTTDPVSETVPEPTPEPIPEPTPVPDPAPEPVPEPVPEPEPIPEQAP